MTGSIEIERCSPARQKQVLALAAQAWPENERAGHWQEIAAALQRGKDDQLVLLAARSGDRLLAAALGQILEGKSAVAWLPQFEEPWDPGDAQKVFVCRAVLEQMAVELSIGGALLAQALLTAEDGAGAEMVRLGGFQRAADLLYLTAEVTADSPAAELLEFVPFQPSDEARLAGLVERTYLGSLDCPLIDGLRETADVLAGYRAVGRFDPRLWQIARQAGSDVGCLLVNVHPEVRHAEIVYLAVTPEARGRGLGQVLVRQANRLAAQTQCDRLVLAVDATNDPAIAMYAACGFVEWDRRGIWIRPLQ